MTRFQKIIASIALCFALFISIGLMLPRDWQVERSITVNATPEHVYPLIANLKTGWPKWNIFDIEDKEGRYIYSDIQQGEGAYRSWTSSKIGNGWQKITQAIPNECITYTLYLERRQFTIHGTIRLSQPTPTTTQITLIQKGKVPSNILIKYLMRAADLAMGDVMKQSLKNLQQASEPTSL